MTAEAPPQEIPLEAVIAEYGDMVYRLAFAQVHSKSDADDIFQEVFLRYLKNHPQLKNADHCKAWLIRVTINCSKKHWASAWQRKTIALEDRSVIHLCYYEGYATAEIAQILGRRESTVRTQLTRARDRLGQLLKGES